MAKVSNLVTFTIIVFLMVLLIYLYYLRKRRTQQSILWLRTQAQSMHAQNQFGQSTMIYPYGPHVPPGQGQHYYLNGTSGVVFMPMNFTEAAHLRNQNLEGASPWSTSQGLGHHPGDDTSHFNPPHFIAAPPYSPGNYASPAVDDLPPPYSAIIATEEPKTEAQTPPPPEDDKTVSETSPANANGAK